MLSNKVVITDSSCFIILDKINALHLLQDLFEVVMTTPEIAHEFGTALPQWVIVEAVSNNELKERYELSVDKGEASAIALAFEKQFDFLILDDLDARKFAEKLGLRIKGTIGIILLAKERGLIRAVKPYIEKVQATDFRISQTVILKALAEADE